MNYLDKYLKYKNKYLKLKQLQYGGNFNCLGDDVAGKRIKDELCIEADAGKYANKIDCEKDCFYLEFNKEIEIWKRYFTYIYDTYPNIQILCKGGSVLGLYVLKILFETNQSEEKLTKFRDLNLIKDWDFTILNVTHEIKEDLIRKAEELNIKNEAQSMIVIRYQKGLKINTDFVFELSIKDHQQVLSDYEIPLTVMTLNLTRENLNLFFDLTRYFSNILPMDLHLLKYTLDKLSEGKTLGSLGNYQFRHGLFYLNNEHEIDKAGLDDRIISLMDIPIDPYNGPSIKQFLITQMREPDRLFNRFMNKNLQKSRKIVKLFTEFRIDIPDWLFSERNIEILTTIINTFLDRINEYVEHTFNSIVEKDITNKQKMKAFYIEIDKFINNINLGRIDKSVIEKNRDLILKLFPYNHVKIIEDDKSKEKLESMKKNPNVPKEALLKPIQINMKTYFNINEKSKYKDFVLKLL
jgi:hypothetical protein